MKWAGSFLGITAGYVIAGSLGGIVGVVLGYIYDRGWFPFSAISPFAHDQKETLYKATFTTMGCVSKVDGQVSAQEIRCAEDVMKQMLLSPQQRLRAISYFEQGKQPCFDIDSMLYEFRHVCCVQPRVAKSFVEVQLRLALADGQVNSVEQRLLIHIAHALGFSREDCDRLSSLLRSTGSTGQAPATVMAAYQVLGISAAASNAEVKQAYRRLLSRYHPDRVLAQYESEQKMGLAKEKTQKICAAYRTLREVRGIK